MAHSYRNIIASRTLKEAGVLVEEITHHIYYVEGAGKYIGNGGAVYGHLHEVRYRLDRLKVTQRNLSKFIEAIDSVISEEVRQANRVYSAKKKEDN